jgi:hypothetical protein
LLLTLVTCNCRQTIRYPKKIRTHIEKFDPKSASFDDVEHLRQKSQGSAGLDQTTDKHSDSRFPNVVGKSNQIRNCVLTNGQPVGKARERLSESNRDRQSLSSLSGSDYADETMRAGGNSRPV